MPLIVVSPHVTTPGSTSDALVHLVDVLPTVADIAGVPLTGPHGEQVESATNTRRELDGRSLLPFLVDPNRAGRQYVYAEGFRPNGDPDAYTIDRKALQDHDWKLVRRDGVEEFYRIDPLTELDTVDLLALPSLDAGQQQAYERLVEEMDRVADSVVYEGF